MIVVPRFHHPGVIRDLLVAMLSGSYPDQGGMLVYNPHEESLPIIPFVVNRDQNIHDSPRGLLQIS